jgi:hypothetical protein
MTTPGLRIEDVFIRVRNDLAELKKRNAQIIQEPVEVNKLNSVFYFVPLKDDKTTQNNSIPEENKKELSTLKILSTANGTIKIDGELKGSIKKNEIKVFKLEPGEYFVQLFTEKDNNKFDEEITLSAAKTETIKFDVKIISQNNLVINIDGKNLEVYPTNLGEMSWQVAKNYCKKLGAGWRLPTWPEMEQIKILLQDKGISSFKSDLYFCCEMLDDKEIPYVYNIKTGAFCQWGFNKDCSIKKAYILPVRIN